MTRLPLNNLKVFVKHNFSSILKKKVRFLCNQIDFVQLSDSQTYSDISRSKTERYFDLVKEQQKIQTMRHLLFLCLIMQRDHMKPRMTHCFHSIPQTPTHSYTISPANPKTQSQAVKSQFLCSILKD